jgi:hypothetical protein
MTYATVIVEYLGIIGFYIRLSVEDPKTTVALEVIERDEFNVMRKGVKNPKKNRVPAALAAKMLWQDMLSSFDENSEKFELDHPKVRALAAALHKRLHGTCEALGLTKETDES